MSQYVIVPVKDEQINDDSFDVSAVILEAVQRATGNESLTEAEFMAMECEVAVFDTGVIMDPETGVQTNLIMEGMKAFRIKLPA